MRSKRLTVLGCACIVVLGGCASKQQTDAAEDVVVTTLYETIENDNPIICKRIVPTGSHLPKRYCAPKATWDAITAASRDMARALDGPGPPPLSR